MAWATFDIRGVSGEGTGCWDGAGFDGRYVYFAPLENSPAVRYDTRRDFSDPGSWSAYDAGPLGMTSCVGIVFDGRYVYFVPYGNHVVVRYDTRGRFSDDDSWSCRDVAGTCGLDTGGGDGGFFDGCYVYFVPFVNPTDAERKFVFHCNFLRYDTRGPFDDGQSWEARDAGGTDGLKTVGYNAGAYDGRFFYLAPWRDGTGSGGMHGRILRYDTVGRQRLL